MYSNSSIRWDRRTRGRTDAIFQLYSRGLSTGKDAYIYNFSRHACAENAQLMTQEYLNALQELEENPELTVEEVTRRHSSNIKWDRELMNNLEKDKKNRIRGELHP